MFRALSSSPLEWFRDEDGDWTAPDGRRGEFVALAVGLPAFAFFTHTGPGLPHPAEHWLAVAVGVWSGFLYAADYLSPVVELLPDWLEKWTLVSLFSSGFGLSVLELVQFTAPTVLFIFAAGGTVLAVYLLRWLSPLHEGFRPARRGVEPPSALESPTDR